MLGLLFDSKSKPLHALDRIEMHGHISDKMPNAHPHFPTDMNSPNHPDSATSGFLRCLDVRDAHATRATRRRSVLLATTTTPWLYEKLTRRHLPFLSYDVAGRSQFVIGAIAWPAPVHTRRPRTTSEQRHHLHPRHQPLVHLALLHHLNLLQSMYRKGVGNTTAFRRSWCQP